MFKLNKIAGSVIAVAAALGSAGVALADGYVPKGKVAYERPTNWSGFYFGVQSGYGWADIDSNITVSPFAGNDGVGNDSVTHGAAFVGAHIGLQHQFGAVVLGIEGNWSSTLRDEYAETTCPNPAITCAKRFNDVLSVGPRIGWAAGHWMPYVTGGYANIGISHESYITPTHTAVFWGGDRFSGWYVGGGFEWAISPGWTAGLEYRHYEFEDKTFLTFLPTGALTGDVRTIDPSLDTITARVSWRWGRPEPRPLK
jgi:opacity protein-like surface antigen